MQNILIIGGTGCVGQETAKHLLNKKETNVFCLSRGKTKSQVLENVKYETGDILDLESLISVLEKHQITHVLHTAALRTSDCKADPALAVKININGTTNVLEALRIYGKARRFLFISTAANYKVIPGQFVTEESPMVPLNAYTATKIACEQMIECYYRNYNIPATIIRPQIIYGPARGTDGSTAGISIALKEAAKGNKYTIPFSGTTSFHFSGDVGKYVGEALLNCPEDFDIYNLPNESMSVEFISDKINSRCPEPLIDFVENVYPFPEGSDATKFLKDFPTCQPTSLDEVLDLVFEDA